MEQPLSGDRTQSPQADKPAPAARFMHLLPVLCLITLGLGLRLWGITWGLPDQNRLFSYHPDEGVNLVSGVLKQGELRPHLDLGFYNYGGLYFYLWQIAAAVNRAYGFIQVPESSAFFSNAPPTATIGALILVGRLLTVLLGAMTVWAVYALGDRLFGRNTGLLAGGIYAILPAAAVHGHFATVDVPATLFAALALLWGAKLLSGADPTGPEKDRPDHVQNSALRSRLRSLATPLLAGLFSGLAAATKYNVGLVILAPLTALILRRKLAAGVSRWETVSVIFGGIAGFLLGCPGAIIEWSKFLEDVRFEWTKTGEGMGLLFLDTGSGWVYHLLYSLRFGLGIPLLLLFLVSLCLALIRRTRQDWYLLAFLLPYYLVIGFAQVKFLRYIIPLLPVIAVLTARLLTEPWHDRPAVGRVLASLGSIVLVLTLGISAGMSQMMASPDPRDQALRYLRASVPPGRIIAFATTPWYYSPPLAPGMTAPSPMVRRESALQQSAFSVRLPAEGTEWDMNVFRPDPPDYVILSDIESQDALRLDWKPAQPFFAMLASSYTPVVFENRLRVFGIPMRKPSYVPNDWLYVYPRITLYARRTP